MKRSRVLGFGCLGTIVLIVALIAAYSFMLQRPFATARAVWDEKGDDNYTLVVKQICMCPNIDEFRITVKAGQVTDAVRVGLAFPGANNGREARPDPSEFDRLTVESMFGRAENVQDGLWMNFTPLVQYDITYDPVYGYITVYDVSSFGIGDTFYYYEAHDLVITQPSQGNDQ